MLSAELARLRQEERLPRDAWVTIWGLRSVHQFLRLPPAAANELEALALREAHPTLSALEAEAGRASAALMIGADVQVGTHRRREVSLTAVPEAEIARQIQPLVDAGFIVRGVCTPAMSLTAVARLHGRTTPGTTAAYVALESNAMCVAIVRDGVLLFAREVPWGFADSAEAVDERLAAELRRSLLFFRQSFRAVVERVVLCGGMPNLRALTASTGAALTLPVETLDSLSGIDAETVPEPADAFRASVAALWPAIAIASQGGDQPNLLQAEARVRRETRTKLAGIAAGVLAAFLAMAAWYIPCWTRTSQSGAGARTRGASGCTARTGSRPRLARRERRRSDCAASGSPGHTAASRDRSRSRAGSRRWLDPVFATTSSRDHQRTNCRHWRSHRLVHDSRHRATGSDRRDGRGDETYAGIAQVRSDSQLDHLV